MKYTKLALLVCLLVVVTGCRSKDVQPIVENQNEQLNRTGQEIVLEGNTTFPSSNNVSGSNSSGNNQEQDIKDSGFALDKSGDFTQITFLDINDWIPYTDADRGFSFLHPVDYIVIEETPGNFILLGEGVGQFFTFQVQEEYQQPENMTLLRQQDVELNTHKFTLEEYETELGATLVSFITQHRGFNLRFSYEYFEGLEDELDMFKQSMMQIKLL